MENEIFKTIPQKNLQEFIGNRIACSDPAEDILKILLHKGFDVQFVSYGKTPFMIAQICERDTLLNILKPYDQDFSKKFLNIKLLGHRFSLKGKLYEGAHKLFTTKSLSNSIEKFSNTNNKFLDVQLLLQECAASLRNFSKNFSVQECCEQYNKGKFLNLATTWHEGANLGHATHLVLYKGLLAKCNRGSRSSSFKSGIHIYRIHQPEKLQEALEAYNKTEETSRQQFFEREIDQMLEADYLYCFSLKDQKTGNCTWVSAKASLWAMLLLKKIANPQLTFKANELYQDIVRYDRFLALKDVFEEIEESETNPKLQAEIDFNDFYKKITLACSTLTRRDDMLTYILSKKPELQKYAISRLSAWLSWINNH
jgi:hypothetical protein